MVRQSCEVPAATGRHPVKTNDGSWQSRPVATWRGVDNLESLKVNLEEGRLNALWDTFVRLYVEGPGLGISVVAGNLRLGGIPGAVTNPTPNKIALRLADTGDYSSLIGVSSKNVPTLVPGRGLTGAGQLIQIAQPRGSLTEAVGRCVAGLADTSGGPQRLGRLETSVDWRPMAAFASVTDERWVLPVGQRDTALQFAALQLFEGEHALIAGRARSGRSTTLLTLARVFKAAAPKGAVFAISPKRSPLQGAGDVIDRACWSGEDVGALSNSILMSRQPTLLLVDDAEQVGFADEQINALIGAGQSHFRLIAAANSDAAFRASFGSWLPTVRRHRIGVILQPDMERDADLLGTRITERVFGEVPAGRGFLVCDSRAQLVHVASSSDSTN